MGDFNQYLWVEKNLEKIKPDVLEIGSKFYSEETFINYRKLCNDNNINYLGTDLNEGRNVDLIIDFTKDMSEIKTKLPSKFNTVICCSVLEHVKDIFRFARNVSSIINTDGVLFLSVPFTWEYHGYPNDYWRFTPSGIEYLFEQFDFPLQYRTISSHLPYDIQPLKDNPNNFCYSELLNGTNHPEKVRPHYNYLKILYHLFTSKKIKNNRILFNSIGTTRIFKVSCINMIGIKKGDHLEPMT
jgi:hypothetical protein